MAPQIFVVSRKVLAHKLAITLEAVHAKVIEQTFAPYGAPEIVNTDQGSQFTAIECTDTVPTIWTGTTRIAVIQVSNGSRRTKSISQCHRGQFCTARNPPGIHS